MTHPAWLRRVHLWTANLQIEGKHSSHTEKPSGFTEGTAWREFYIKTQQQQQQNEAEAKGKKRKNK